MRFETYYKQLNGAQRQAVDTIDGPVMVVAGPGTGKTTVLTLRIANILRETDTDPSSILALTFTESGVTSMREKLVGIIGSDAYKIKIHTFHGFCNDVIRTFPEEFPRIVGATNVTDVDQIRILERIITEGDYDRIKPYGDPFYYLRPGLGMILNLKREGVSTEDFQKLVAKQQADFDDAEDKYYESGKYEGKLKGAYIELEKDIARNTELLALYEAYEKALMDERLFDFEDMILEVVRKLESDEDFRLRVQERTLYILADEHQDANFSQNKLLELLASFYESPNLFIVGDEKQAIFRFQGASLENFLYFKDRYPEAELINLTDNYRSVQSVLDSAHSLITSATDEGIERKPLKAFATDPLNPQERGGQAGRPMLIHEFSHPDVEHTFVAQQIQKQIEAGVEPSEIAVIYRDNRDAFPMAEALERLAIPFVIESNQNILADPDMQKLLLLFRTIENLGDDELLTQTLFLDFFNIAHVDVYQVSRFRHAKKRSLASILRSDKLLEEAGIEDVTKLRELFRTLTGWGALTKNTGVLEVFETIVRDSGYLSNLLGLTNSAEKINKLDGLFEEARKASERHHVFTLAAFLEHIALIERYNLSIKVNESYRNPHSVRLMTAHRSKGLEFEQVYVIGVNDGHWGNRRVAKLFNVPVQGLERLKEDSIDDERRLLYVAMTRAKKGLSVSYSKQRADGKEQIKSQFIEEIDQQLREEIDTTSAEQEIIPTLQEEKFQKKESHGVSVQEKKFLNATFLEQGLSVSALNNYLECPWQYFFRNLIRVPQAPNKFQRYGIAVHEALRQLFDRYKETGEKSSDFLLDVFRQEITRLAVSERELKELLAKGEKSLVGYYAKEEGGWSRNILNEYNIAGVFIDLSSDEKILLRGILDTVEIQDDGKTVHIVDYKTSKPQSRNVIEGKTKTSNGNYKRQLVFYKILFDEHEQGRQIMQSGEINFTEPNTKGEYKKEIFEITEAEVAELREMIKRVGDEILNLDFWTETCDNLKCEHCALRATMSQLQE